MPHCLQRCTVMPAKLGASPAHGVSQQTGGPCGCRRGRAGARVMLQSKRTSPSFCPSSSSARVQDTTLTALPQAHCSETTPQSPALTYASSAANSPANRCACRTSEWATNQQGAWEAR